LINISPSYPGDLGFIFELLLIVLKPEENHSGYAYEIKLAGSDNSHKREFIFDT